MMESGKTNWRYLGVIPCLTDQLVLHQWARVMIKWKPSLVSRIQLLSLCYSVLISWSVLKLFFHEPSCQHLIWHHMFKPMWTTQLQTTRIPIRNDAMWYGVYSSQRGYPKVCMFMKCVHNTSFLCATPAWTMKCVHNTSFLCATPAWTMNQSTSCLSDRNKHVDIPPVPGGH